MCYKELTDQEIEYLYKSTNDLNDLINKVLTKTNFNESEKYSINFDENIVNIKFKNQFPKKIKYENLLSLCKEIIQQNISDKNFQEYNINKNINISLQREIFKIEDNIYKIHNEFIEYLYLSSDIASAYENYLKNFEKLKSIFDRKNNILYIENLQITSKDELIRYLHKYGFKKIDNL